MQRIRSQCLERSRCKRLLNPERVFAYHVERPHHLAAGGSRELPSARHRSSWCENRAEHQLDK
jgi:hypothetical protein